ncbi:UDP-N-acetylmuramate--L-alanine ligase [Saccharopolyspora erythraea NRRL 2338]|uniref:UDP-N-acetylmuramate--L-alanine ligase n=3 Tax=Saccharopolyspora erythraea TaxID=1836 RepID=MURC_SACEN|nr:UDP-N-acetylmuramate--L-alanine ligase [Saccharopolyspora erythraea]A4FLV9.1 RecName: Full=UDP-N-acetylmuramate--L-alanine ligase; AltName: Full=UDP-N-acetylmuramoyl-L-alanine synthetase [Saccharopolyspora erythraea NRRL 2338]PFG98672.1 UDP-N-acetylmuramate--L-alanine ligase [Saccharopolyspora erythraea NRRL 2338]QRK88691.1 UDP-N-acetylmuramate--L-alanine ligase [Saccharopolyspora erythraea]CAM05034.1 UDP-N-acetylmuramate--alanine ligase [Saccharopolyspora erythraea NRRL 2338]
MRTDAAGGTYLDPSAADVTALLERVHLVGIGGAGMSGIARILLARGRQVSGSDARDSRTVLALKAQGAHIALGHRAENIEQFDGDPTAVVVSTAIRRDNPELVAAQERGVPVLRRAEALAALMADHRVACVAGTHGKTSTTSMLTVALQHCRLDPSFAIGGDLNESGANAHHGDGGVFVAEADESDGSFLVFAPSVAVVTNVEPDHLDHHGTAEAYTEVFQRFVERIEPGGVLIACADDAGAALLADQAEAAGVRVRRYGHEVTADGDARMVGYRPEHGSGVVTVEVSGDRLDVQVAVPGEHMAANAVAALLAGLELGAPLEGLLEGLAAFGGVRRRFEFKGRADGVRVYDDYAHHPTEVDAQLRAARPVVGDGRLVVVFQPHLYSRTAAFSGEFATALGLADEVVVLDVYGAREDPQPGVTGELIAESVPLPAERVHYEASFTAAAPLVAGLVQPGDLVLTMGAGDVTMLGPEILAEVERESGATEEDA